VIRAVFLLTAGLVLLIGLPPMPTLPVWTRPTPAVPVVPVVPAKASAAVYVYEKSDAAIPHGVTVGLDKLNRERSVVATLCEVDTVNGADKVPAQYQPAVDAAKAKGLPALVVLSGSAVLSIVAAPTTAEEIGRAVE
jgi:hypothetical protein